MNFLELSPSLSGQKINDRKALTSGPHLFLQFSFLIARKTVPRASTPSFHVFLSDCLILVPLYRSECPMIRSNDLSCPPKIMNNVEPI